LDSAVEVASTLRILRLTLLRWSKTKRCNELLCLSYVQTRKTMMQTCVAQKIGYSNKTC
jgi:hypothetical protein